MKSISALTAMIGLGLTGGTAFAQLSTLPLPSTSDGVAVTPTDPLNSGASHWDDPSGILAYNVSSNVTVPVPGTPDSITGKTWGAAAPSAVWGALGTVNSAGGTIRGIYVGESAGWLNDFGYTYDKSPVTDSAASFTVFSNIQSVGSPNVTFGDHVDIDLLPTQASTFDFWLNGSGRFDTVKQSGTPEGGVFTALTPSNSSPFISGGNVRWTQSPIFVSTWIPAAGKYENVATYLASFEDSSLVHPYDRDFSDFILGVQILDVNGNPLGNTPVPEASTYGIVGALGLLGLAALRRSKKSAAAVAV